VDKLQITEDQLTPTKSFLGVNSGATHPWGKIELPMTFGSKDNYRTENIIFYVADIALPYNGTHHAYHALKLPSPRGTLTVKSDTRYFMLYDEHMLKVATTTSPSHLYDLDHSRAPIPSLSRKILRPFPELSSNDS
jgi:hypothetical protein